jgi:hypothetical protein
LAGLAPTRFEEGWQRIEIEKVIARCGLRVLDHPTREDLIERYFANRSDGLLPYTAEGLIAATLGEKPAAND